MKTGRNLPRGHANQENQEELQRMERRRLSDGAPGDSGNPWETIMHKDEQHAPYYRRQYIHFDWEYLVVLLVIAAAAILVVLFASSARAEDAIPAFSEGQVHVSTPEYAAYFETISASQDAVTLSFRKNVYEESQATVLWDIVTADLQRLSVVTGISVADFQPHTVYIVDRPVNRSIERLDNRVYCTSADVESGAYRPLLFCAALGTEEYWIGEGLSMLLRDDAIDDAALREYFTQTGTLDLLSHFSPELFLFRYLWQKCCPRPRHN